MAAQINVQSLLAYGESAIGDPYVYGSAGPDSFDCSGLIKWMYAHFGVNLPHHAADQAKLGSAVDPDKIAAGDLVFSDWGDGPDSHVGIATDASHVLVAPQTGQNVKVESLTPNYRKKITSVRRVGNLVSSAQETEGSGSTVTPPPATTGSTGSTDAGISIPLAAFGTGLGGLAGGTAGVDFGSWWSDLWTAAGGTIDGAVAKAKEPLTLVAAPLYGIADFFENLTLLFKPTNFLRLVSGVGGVALILIGVWFLAGEVRNQ